MDSLAALYGDKKLIFLTGVLRDKDWQQMLRRALPLARRSSSSRRLLPAHSMKTSSPRG